MYLVISSAYKNTNREDVMTTLHVITINANINKCNDINMNNHIYIILTSDSNDILIKYVFKNYSSI